MSYEGESTVKRLGYTLTWKTHCFLPNGCGQTGLFGHTNGFGDFVLFDSLGWPWPVHECYEQRCQFRSDGEIISIGGSRDIHLYSSPSRTWDTVKSVSADLERHRRPVHVIGTITNVEGRFLSRVPGFRDLSNKQKAVVEQSFGSSRDLIVVVSGEGFEYPCFVDLRRSPAKFRDTVALKMKAARLLNQVVFVSQNLKVFQFDD